MKIHFREMRESDRAFVVSHWASSYRDSYSAGIISNSDWHQVIRPTINGIIDRDDMKTIVAFDPSADPRTKADLFGFVCGSMSPAYVAFVYVRDGARRGKVATWLLEQLGVAPDSPFEYACRTAAVSRLIEAGKIPRAIWNPLRVRRGEQERAA